MEEIESRILAQETYPGGWPGADSTSIEIRDLLAPERQDSPPDHGLAYGRIARLQYEERLAFQSLLFLRLVLQGLLQSLRASQCRTRGGSGPA